VALESSYNHGHASAFASTGAAAGEAESKPQRGVSLDTIGAQVQTLAALLNRSLRNALRSEELSAAHWKILKQIEKSGPAAVDAIAAALETGRSGIATLANQLIGLGYIGVDHASCLALSPVGQAVILRIERTIRVQQDWLTVSVDSQDLATFKNVCKSLADVLKSGQMGQPNAIPEQAESSGAALV